MATITTKDATEIFYKDWGPKNVQPIVFHHGWLLPIGLDPSGTGIANGSPMENCVVSNKTQDNNSLGLSESNVMADHASVTAEGTSTSTLGDEPTYDEEVREDIEDGDFCQVTARADCSGNLDR